MAEFEFKVKPYGVDCRCDKCNKGVMMYTEGNMKINNLQGPPKFTHRCNSCGHEQDYFEKYPVIRWRYD